MSVYNEEATVEKSLKGLLNVDFGMEREVIVFDDGSTDATPEILKSLAETPGLRLESFSRNRGKGHAIRRGISLAVGDLITFHDADLELNPEELKMLIEPILRDEADAVYGTRFLQNQGHLHLHYLLANKLLARLTNALYGTKLSDIYTCYKMVKAEHAKAILPFLSADAFSIEAEMTALLAKSGITIHERPITFHPRGHKDGKKIHLRDGIEAIIALVKFRFVH